MYIIYKSTITHNNIIIIGFLLRLIGPALHYKHNLFNRIYATNSIKEVIFIM